MYYGGNQRSNRVSAWQSQAVPQGQAVPADQQATDHFPCPCHHRGSDNFRRQLAMAGKQDFAIRAGLSGKPCDGCILTSRRAS